MRRAQNFAEEMRRVHQFHLHTITHRPPTHQQQGSQTSGIQLLDFGNIKHQHTDTFQLLDPSPELVERCPTHHTPGAVYDRYVLQAFDLKFKFHMSVHTNLPWKKFPDRLSLNWTSEKRKSNPRKAPRRGIQSLNSLNLFGGYIINDLSPLQRCTIHKPLTFDRRKKNA
jgi:hypothetical protein